MLFRNQMTYSLRLGVLVWAQIPPFLKGGPGGIRNNSLIIPLNPPLEKGDFLKAPIGFLSSNLRDTTLKRSDLAMIHNQRVIA